MRQQIEADMADEFEFDDVPSPVRAPQEAWDQLAAIALLKSHEATEKAGRRRTVSRNAVTKNALLQWLAAYVAEHGDPIDQAIKLGLYEKAAMKRPPGR